MDSNHRRNYFVDFLAMSFGIAAWAGVTGTFLQLPQITQTAPEGENLPAYIAILTQSGNIVSLLYIIYEKWSPVRFDDANLIYLTLSIGCFAALFMAFFYDTTIYVGGIYRSIPLLVCTFMFAIVGCLSSVLFMPFMGRFRGIYLVTYMFGQGLNGLLTSVLSLIQGIGTPKCVTNTITNITAVHYTESHFDSKIYFLLIFALLLFSSFAFFLLNTMETCKSEYASIETNQKEIETNTVNGKANDYQAIPTNTFSLTSVNFYYLMITLSVISFLTYGFFPGIMAYSCDPYGFSAYHLASTLLSIANPVACLFSLYISRPSVRDVIVLSTLTTVCIVYIFITALQGPTPPFHTLAFGSYLIITVWTSFTAFGALIKLTILQLFRCHGHKTLKWAGAVIQSSSFIGAIIVFFLVNQTKLFTKSNPCQN
ncbi:solute carrier family 52, riboflavin transporter, member 3-B-like [Contarinia nasturtii]|uniref:solute carrier family 52, riboflavin transporter, member 3-B-like n=1 Tax=Contarinia nasturtii TaxID=265458 RepID=UPI0012D41204|nr:solute carrier family 52, riboflavin transporter, member 3-B-like [Contarinia nasturtii]